MRTTGRLTADAVVRTTKTGKNVVDFTVAETHRYTSNGEKKK